MRINQFLADMGGEPPVNARYFAASAAGCQNPQNMQTGCGAPNPRSGMTCGAAGTAVGTNGTVGGVQEDCMRGAADGSLNTPAAIAMTYTPVQKEGGCLFDAETALSRGTIFSGLDLPLWNDYRVGALPAGKLSEVQALSFAAHELALYLDTHPDDAEALRLYNAYQRAANEKRAQFADEEFALLRSENADDTVRYSWVDDPWPWQRQNGRGNR